MIVYHGSTEIINNPDVKFSKNYLDFGRGFYVTTYKEQAEKWAKRRSMRNGKNAIVNVYELSDILDKYNYTKFNDDDKWLNFVCECRRGKDIYKQYDYISGSVADDDVFKSIDMYFKGLWDEERTLKEIRYYKMNNQICLTNQQIIFNELKFLESYEVK